MINVVFFKITLALYFLATAFFLTFLSSRNSRWARVPLYLTWLGFLFHSLAIAVRTFEAGHLPLINLHEAMSFFSWAVILTFLLMEYRYRAQILGSFILPLAFISLISAATLPTEIRTLDPKLQSVWLEIHTMLALSGMVAFSIAFITGLIYLIQEHFLKSKHLSPLYHNLPSLELLDRLNRRAILVGFPLLTMGMITGALWAHYVWGSFWRWDPKVIVALVTWFFYLIVLHGQVTIGWTARKGALLAIIGFGGVVFTFVFIFAAGMRAVL